LLVLRINDRGDTTRATSFKRRHGRPHQPACYAAAAMRLRDDEAINAAAPPVPAYNHAPYDPSFVLRNEQRI
jgi:hypothetical protein